MTNRVVTVLYSFTEPRPTSNPYVIQLMRSMPPDVRMLTFSWRRALLGRWDVFHVHWPEVLLRGTTRWRTFGRLVLTLILLARIKLTGRALVRTLHNLRPHEPPTRLQSAILRLFDRWTTEYISLTPATLDYGSKPQTVILHGDYRQWYASYRGGPVVPGRLLFFGFIRPYKQVEKLLSAFLAADDPSLTLNVVGQPQSDALGHALVELASRDPRVTLLLRHASDSQLSHQIAEAELVVLPYSEMINSGAALLALSLDRPVLLPASPAAERLANEVGPGWVEVIDGDLTGTTVQHALADVRRTAGARGPRPDLSLRRWTTIGGQHAGVYRSASVRTSDRRNRLTGVREAWRRHGSTDQPEV